METVAFEAALMPLQERNGRGKKAKNNPTASTRIIIW